MGSATVIYPGRDDVTAIAYVRPTRLTDGGYTFDIIVRGNADVVCLHYAKDEAEAAAIALAINNALRPFNLR